MHSINIGAKGGDVELWLKVHCRSSRAWVNSHKAKAIAIKPQDVQGIASIRLHHSRVAMLDSVRKQQHLGPKKVVPVYVTKCERYMLRPGT